MNEFAAARGAIGRGTDGTRADGDFEPERTMAKRLQYRRVLMLVVLVLLAFAGLGYRLVDLQVLRHDELSVKAQENTQLEFSLEPRRGDILDAKGNLLATSVLVKTVCADPTTLGNHQTEVARTLAPLLQLTETEILQKL